MNITLSQRTPKPILQNSQATPAKSPSPQDTPVQTTGDEVSISQAAEAKQPTLKMSKGQVEFASLLAILGAGALAVCNTSSAAGAVAGAFTGAMVGYSLNTTANLAQGLLPEKARFSTQGGMGLGLLTGAVAGALGANPLVAAAATVGTSEVVERSLKYLSGQKTDAQILAEGSYMYANGELIFLHPDLPQPR